MRILMLTQLFQPEPNHLKGIAFARELVERGHDVEILTGFPNYPGGKLYPGYRMRRAQRELMDGIPVNRVALYPSHDRSGIRRFLNYASFAMSAGLQGSFHVRAPDVIHVYQGPATLAAPAMVLGRQFRAPYVLDVQDLWPDSVAASGMLKIPGGLPLLHRWCDRTYRNAAEIVVLSEGYRDTLVKRSVPREKLHVIYNWTDECEYPDEIPSDPAEGVFDPTGKFNIVYAGNLGSVQNLSSVLRAAARLNEDLPHVRFVLVGGGVEQQALQRLAVDLRLTNVRFVPRQPAAKIRQILSRADALLMHLRDAPLSGIGIPQKTQAYLSAGRPILAALPGEAGEMVMQAGAGIQIPPDEPEAMVRGVRELACRTEAQLAEMGRRGRSFYESKLSFRVGVSRMEAVFQKAALRREPAIRRIPA
jgi:glycosyltransferase involved in cell wall biosynthesis